MRIESFSLDVERPDGPFFEGIERQLAGLGALRWAIVAVRGETLRVEGARLIPCSPSSI